MDRTAFYDLAKFIGRLVGRDVPTSTMRFPESTRRGVTHTRVVLSLFERKATESCLSLSLSPSFSLSHSLLTLTRGSVSFFHSYSLALRLCLPHCHRADRAPRFICKASDTGVIRYTDTYYNIYIYTYVYMYIYI